MGEGTLSRGVECFQRHCGVLKLALEKRWGAEIPSKHAAIPWTIEHAAYLLNRFEVGHDGKTAYERLKAGGRAVGQPDFCGLVGFCLVGRWYGKGFYTEAP
jgi:hypothetical protein